jgi:hypothetical protein
VSKLIPVAKCTSYAIFIHVHVHVLESIESFSKFCIKEQETARWIHVLVNQPLISLMICRPFNKGQYHVLLPT